MMGLIRQVLNLGQASNKSMDICDNTEATSERMAFPTNTTK